MSDAFNEPILPAPDITGFSADAPRATVSEHGDTEVIYTVNGELFTDGRVRFILPSKYFTAEDAHELSDALERRDDAIEDITRFIRRAGNGN